MTRECKGTTLVQSRRTERILIVGCGNLGCRLAVHLGSVADVVCLESDRLVVRTIQSKGICLIEGLRKRRRRVCISGRIKDYAGQEFDSVIFATKCHDVKGAMQVVARHCQAKAVVFLQNGDFSLQEARRLFAGADIVRGVSTSAMQARGAGEVMGIISGVFFLGQYSGAPGYLRRLAKIFNVAGLRTSVVSDYKSAVWAKMIFSAVMNPLPVITGADYGIIQKDKNVDRVVREAFVEGKRVAEQMKISLAFDPMAIVRRLKAGKFGDFRYKGSMYYDFINGRPLETEYITGELLRQANACKLKTPALEAIYSLVKAMEVGRDRSAVSKRNQ